MSRQDIQFRERGKTKDLVVTGLLTALIFIFTRFINIRLPISINGGLIHMGNVMLFATAIVFGKKKAAVSGALGMSLFDVMSGWTAWAPFTFVVRGIMGYIIGWIAERENGKNVWMNLLGITAGGIWMLFGYYMTEVMLYGNWITPFTSVYGNMIQIVVGAIIGTPVAMALLRARVDRI